jgi:hypothetical protein
MRKVVGLSLGLSVGLCVGIGGAFLACGGGSSQNGFPGSDAGLFSIGDSGGRDGSVGSDGALPSGDTGHLMGSGDAGMPPPGDGSIITMTKTTIYAHTDTELFSMDPSTKMLTDIGTFHGTSGGYYDSTITDLAVNAAGDVYVNSETVVYSVTMPATPGAGAAVNLTPVVNTAPGVPDGGTPPERFYALAFAPAGALDSGEVLIGGDSKGELWAIPTTAGQTPFDVGNFGTDPSVPLNFLALSGDLVFYMTGSTPTGLATIRSCVTSSGTCIETNDYLAGVNMVNLKANYVAKSNTNSLLAGIYGGTATADGPGTGHGEIYGLGAWQGDVYGFTRCVHCYDGGSGPVQPQLLQIDPSTGAGSVITPSFPFTDGWSGAGVTTKVTITIIQPPPTMPPPK